MRCLRRSILLTLASGAILWQSFLPLAVMADANDVRSLGLSAYSRGDYTAAIGFLNSAIAAEPSNQELHYYLANALAMDRQFENARYHYWLAYHLDPLTLVAKYCLEALAIGNSAPSNLQQKSYENVVRVDRARKQLMQQGQDAAQYRYTRGVMSAGSRMDLGQKQMETIQNHENDALEEMRGMRLGTPNMSVPLYSSKQIEAVRQQYREQENQAKQAAQYSAASRRTSAIEKSNLIEDSASGLASQLSPNTTGFSLVPEGTSLYIRNYASSAASPPANADHRELLATPEKLVLDQHYRSGKNTGHIVPVPFAAKAGTLPSGSSFSADLKVHGQLISPR